MEWSARKAPSSTTVRWGIASTVEISTFRPIRAPISRMSQGVAEEA